MTNLINESDAGQIVSGNHSDPFSVLGQHKIDGKLVIRAFYPNGDGMDVLDAETGRKVVSLKMHSDGLFVGVATRRKEMFAYRLRITAGAHVWEADDPNLSQLRNYP